MHDRNAARRVLAGHLTNLYAGVIDAEACVRNVRKLSTYGGEQADVELEGMAAELADELEAGGRPTLVLPELGLQVAPDPDAEVEWAGRDGPKVVPEADARRSHAETVEAARTAAEERAGERQAGEPDAVVDADTGPAAAPPDAPPEPEAQADGDPGAEAAEVASSAPAAEEQPAAAEEVAPAGAPEGEAAEAAEAPPAGGSAHAPEAPATDPPPAS